MWVNIDLAMACCQHLNHGCLIIKVFFGIHLRAISQEGLVNLTRNLIHMCSEMKIFKLLPHCLGQWVTTYIATDASIVLSLASNLPALVLALVSCFIQWHFCNFIIVFFYIFLHVRTVFRRFNDLSWIHLIHFLLYLHQPIPFQSVHDPYINMFRAADKRWKKIRHSSTPSFSNSKIKLVSVISLHAPMFFHLNYASWILPSSVQSFIWDFIRALTSVEVEAWVSNCIPLFCMDIFLLTHSLIAMLRLSPWLK